LAHNVGRRGGSAYLKTKLTSFGLSRTGNGESDDYFETKTWDETIVAALADGLGACRDGREAAVKVVRSLISNYELRPKTWNPRKTFHESCRLSNRALYLESQARHDSAEMVTTLAAVAIEGNKLFGINVGDSRVYLLRQGNLHQLSTDDVAGDRHGSHVLERAMGLQPEVEPHLFERELMDGDLVLLCSDGVTNALGYQRLNSLVTQRLPARDLVAAAREAASDATRDDVSAVVIDIAETGKRKAMEELALIIPDTLQKGADVDGFRLIKPLQKNDRIWLADHDGKRYLLKFAPREARDDERILNLFVQEEWNAARLEADYFVRSRIPANQTHRFYAMEYIDAPNLRTVLTTRRLDVDEAVALGKFLLNAGQFLLRYDLVHGDIKPDNILVLRDDDAWGFKLVDMGNLCEIFSVTSRAGTPSYLAPERFHAAPASERTELYAIAATMFQALTGRYPYGEIEPFQTPHFHALPSPVKLNPNIPPWLEAVLQRALAVDPSHRHEGYSEMLYELEHPDRVCPFYRRNAPLLERNPVLFYKALAALLFLVNIVLLVLLSRT
jgi:serine/threonine protein phosphatase PrpC